MIGAKGLSNDDIMIERQASTILKQHAEIEQLREALGRAHREALSLAQSIWRSEYRRKSPDWEPCDTVAGIITQIDNMYAGVRRQRDEARAALQAGEGDK